jgi:hypothetical protein
MTPSDDTTPPQGARTVWIPQTPAGTNCEWLMSDTEAEAWKRLLKDAAHMPYRGIGGFKRRGYAVIEWTVAEQPKRKNSHG